jgi:hypothetical protein
VATSWSQHFGSLTTERSKIFLTIWTSWALKDAEFYEDFKNINLLSDKSYSIVKIFVSTHEALFV